MPKNYTLQNGATLLIADKPLGEGAEGAVYEIISPIDYTKLVAKILFADKRTNERRYKVRYMVDNPPANIQDGNGHNLLIWPLQILFDNNDFVGFIMPKAEGVDLEELCRVKLKPELGSEWQKFYRDSSDSMVLRLILCNNIAKAVNALHATGHYVIGDLKPENVKVKSNGLVSILDLDSCQISDSGEIRFQSKMNTPKYNPPDKIVTHKEVSWDLFILGIIFYEVLCGIHPFIGTTKAPYENLNTPEQKIQAGLFPFGSKSNYFEVIANPHNNYNALPDRVRKLFLLCFDQGILSPFVRPNTADWLNNLTAKPNIVYFKSDRETIISGIEITLSWKVEGADKIEIDNGIGRVSEMGKIDIRPQVENEFTITVANKFGTDQQKVCLTIFPTPLIESLQISTPIFSHQTSISKFKIETPQINLNISLNPVTFVSSTIDFEQLNSNSENFFLKNHNKSNPISEVFEILNAKIKQNLKKIFIDEHAN